MTPSGRPRRLAVEAERIRLPGPAGALDVLIETPRDSSSTHFAVICHPHPLYGGTMDNKVVYTLSRALQEFGMPTLRFNFRGVGASEGTFDEGRGETDDTLSVIAAGRDRWPDAQLWLAGFSFGGAVAIRAAAQGELEGLITVAPAVTRVEVSVTPPTSAHWLVVQGEADDVVEPQAVLDWARRLPHPPQIDLLAGVGHFFHGKLPELRAAVVNFVQTKTRMRTHASGFSET